MMPTLLPRLATSELVALAWIRDVVTTYGVAAGTTLQGPDPETQVLSWGDTGFITALTVGGSIDNMTPMRQPVMAVEFVATNVGKSRPPWGRAVAIAEVVIDACRFEQVHDTQRPVTLPTGFPLCRVWGASVLTEPERRSADEANYAKYGFEMMFSWVAL